MIPVLIDVLEANCTLGEITRTMAEVFGEYHDHG